MSFSKKVKNNVKKAVAYVNDFEVNAAEIAIDRKYDYVACGHIHNPQIRTISNKKGSVVYLNSGDWIEHLSALEYNEKTWKIFTFEKEMKPAKKSKEKMPQYAPSPKELVERVLDTSETVRYEAFFSPTNKK